MQQSLDKWFVRKDTEGHVIESMPSVFFLDWRPKDGIIEAKWLHEPPTDVSITYQTQIEWKNKTKDNKLAGFTINLNIIAHIDDSSINGIIEPENFYTNISFLKSHLQKCIRRSNVKKALLTAQHFMALDLNQFLRRLPIIMIEDVHINKAFSPLVWLMVAHSKGYTLRQDQIYWLLGIVVYLANSPYKHNYQSKSKTPIVIKKMSMSHFHNEQKALLFSMQLRKSYGGLGGDKEMIDDLTIDWYNRFKSQQTTQQDIQLMELFNQNIMSIMPLNLKLGLEDWILPAIDFHCEQSILSILCDKFDQYNYDQIKEAIWLCSSGYNNKQLIYITNHSMDMKTKVNKNVIEVWNIIRGQVYSLAQYYLEHRY